MGFDHALNLLHISRESGQNEGQMEVQADFACQEVGSASEQLQNDGDT